MSKKDIDIQLYLPELNPKDKPVFISKSRFMSGRRCPRLLWLDTYDKSKLSGPNFQQKILFRQGQDVGKLAHQLFSTGIALPMLTQPMKHHRQSLRYLEQRKPLFEAGFVHERAFAMSDVLEPTRDGWNLYEVKSSTSVKPNHLWDVAFQRYVLEGAGVAIKKTFLVHVDRDYRRKGELSAEDFFYREDISKNTRDLQNEVKADLKRITSILDQKSLPPQSEEPHCFNPGTCPLRSLCWDFLPDRSVFELHRGHQKAHDLVDLGIVDFDKIPDNFSLTPNQDVQLKATREGKEHVDHQRLQQFLGKLEYPLYLLDFESFQMAIPPFQNMRPYEQLPFQYSLHVVQNLESPPLHISYLSREKCDNRQDFLEHLKSHLGDTGSIVAYSASFEIQRIQEAVGKLEKHQSWMKKTIKRFVDLHEPFRQFAYYHPDQRGSTSIKAVLPCLTDLTYDTLEIRDGHRAATEYLRTLFHPMEEKDIELVYQQLLDYCEQDTFAMLEIIKGLAQRAA